MRRARGQLEAAVLAVIGSATGPLTVADVADALHSLHPFPAYTTVLTTLARLYNRGVLDRTPRGRGHAYGPAADPSRAGAVSAAESMHRLLRAEGSRADVLSRFVAELEPEDDRVLRSLLAEFPDRPEQAGR